MDDEEEARDVCDVHCPRDAAQRWRETERDEWEISDDVTLYVRDPDGKLWTVDVERRMEPTYYTAPEVAL